MAFLCRMLIILILLFLSVEIYTAPVKLTTFEEQKETANLQVTKNTPAISHTVIKNGQGAVYEWQSDTITVRLTGAQTQGLFTLTEDVMKPTFKLGLHLHRKHAETFHIIEGDVEFRLGTETHVAQAGTTIHVPSNTPHAVQVINGKQARMIMLYSPAGFENFLKEMKTFTDEQFADEIFMKAFNDKYDNIQLE
ncbi:unnamed protein product [Rotaria sp. Silwood1]|nr:unnamed protein product [Rotaria sp. Silwood1]CAF1482000.1 unnamed protein product [Rotaria sp. Silwood1]CAF3592070.1 unnamed protein product [Rotaria sp. Silwood1]CAF4645392.1 unnamed protein product [Rotaria sp. Silwood1]